MGAVHHDDLAVLVEARSRLVDDVPDFKAKVQGQRCKLQSGLSGFEKGFVIWILKMSLLPCAARQLQYSPAACETIRKHFTNPFHNLTPHRPI